MKKISIAIACVLCVWSSYASSPAIVPKPEQLKSTSGSFNLSSRTTLSAPASVAAYAKLLQQFIKKDTGIGLKISNASGGISLKLTGSSNSPETKEAYQLSVTPAKVTITASDKAGLYNGIATLRYLIQPSSKLPIKIPCLEIKDKPAYKYRGMMLDCGRHFYTKEFIKRFIDILAIHKMNIFHWHFVEDAGWRPEIKGYPDLITKGAFRSTDGVKIGGYYSINDMKEIVKYAEVRNITIIPEIEVPAHTLAALVAYPELGCVGKGYKMPQRQFISKDIYCPGKKSTWKFLGTVFNEICDIFPGGYIHVGGDEARYNRWKKCEACQALMKREGLKSEEELQGWMVRKIEKIVKARGKKLIGWDAILQCGVSKDTAIMVWYNKKAAAKGAENGNPVVVAFTSNCYFDTPESSMPGEPPAATWIPPISLRKAYNWDPMPANLAGAAKKNIIGVEGCIWSDQVLNHRELQPRDVSEKYVEYLLLPRVAALAEVGWTPKEMRNWDDFKKRMSSTYLWYEKLGYNFRIPIPEVTVEKTSNGRIKISAVSPVEKGVLKYEIGKKIPNASSPEMKSPMTISQNDTIRIVTYLPLSKRCSIPYIHPSVKDKYAIYGGIFVGEWKVSHKAEEFTFDLTGKITADGIYRIKFIRLNPSRGRTSLGRLSILRNGKDTVGEDRHRGAAGTVTSNANEYTVNVKGYKAGAKFEAKIKLSDKGESEGIVVLEKGYFSF